MTILVSFATFALTTEPWSEQRELQMFRAPKRDYKSRPDTANILAINEQVRDLLVSPIIGVEEVSLTGWDGEWMAEEGDSPNDLLFYVHVLVDHDELPPEEALSICKALLLSVTKVVQDMYLEQSAYTLTPNKLWNGSTEEAMEEPWIVNEILKAKAVSPYLPAN